MRIQLTYFVSHFNRANVFFNGCVSLYSLSKHKLVENQGFS